MTIGDILAQDWEAIGKALGVFIGGLVVSIGVIAGKKRSDGTPPENRPLPTQEMRDTLCLMRDQISKNREVVTDEMRRVVASIDRLDHSLRMLEMSIRERE